MTDKYDTDDDEERAACDRFFAFISDPVDTSKDAAIDSDGNMVDLWQ